MKEKFVKYYMDVADLTSKLSYAKRLNVGAVIVKGNKILGTGYNGMPAGWDNNCEYEHYSIGNPNDFELKTRSEVLHAESNAIAKVASSTESSENATMFCTHAPCIECAKLIYQSGIKTLYYEQTYRTEDGINFLIKSSVNVIQFKR